MADIAGEIVEFMKVKDRPSPLGLRVVSTNGTTLISITAPVKNGLLV
jgi:hypothetical protein